MVIRPVNKVQVLQRKLVYFSDQAESTKCTGSSFLQVKNIFAHFFLIEKGVERELY